VRNFWCALLIGVAAAAAAAAPAAAAGVGVVLLHARNSMPPQFDGIVPRLAAAGYPSVAVNACWSDRRSYPATAEECQRDIDAAIAELKGRGMDRFVIAGNDFGGLYALYYAGSHPEIAGVIAWGPRIGRGGGNQESLATALKAVQSGEGDKPGIFNNGRPTTARQWLSFEGQDSPFADVPALLSKVSVPVLWMAANDDLGPRDPTSQYNLIKPDAQNALMWSVSDQYSMVDVSLPQAIDWLNKIRGAGQ
jgi:dienelactone hydrolase